MWRAVPTDPDIAARLSALAGAQRVPGGAIEMVVVRGFLGTEECVGLCRLIDARRRPSGIADDLGDAAFRTSETCDLDASEPVVAALEARLTKAVGIDPALGEPIQGQRYAPGQEFKPHTDTFEPGGADFYNYCGEQGQRSWTAMVYLNEPEEGGATRFKAIGKTIQPETGKLVAWNNLLPDRRPNPATLHQGMKVRRGIKTIVTKWYRERPAG